MSKEKVEKFLELQEQGQKVNNEVALQLGYTGKEPKRSLRNELNRYGYKSVDGIYVKADECEDNCAHSNTNNKKCEDNDNHSNSMHTTVSTTVSTTEGITSETEDKTDNSAHNSKHNSAHNNEDESIHKKSTHNSAYKSNTLDDVNIKKLLTLANNFDKIMSNTSRVESVQVTSCKSPTAQTVKVDHEVWQKFKKFAKASDLKQQDLLSTALVLLMDKMSQ